MTDALKNLLKEGPVLSHAKVELDGIPSSIKELQTVDLKGVIVRISKHLYMDGKALTVDAPKWNNLWK